MKNIEDIYRAALKDIATIKEKYSDIEPYLFRTEQMLEAVKPMIFKIKSGKKSELNAHKWLAYCCKSAIKAKQRNTLRYLFFDGEKTFASNGNVMNVFDGKLLESMTEPGFYDHVSGVRCNDFEGQQVEQWRGIFNRLDACKVLSAIRVEISAFPKSSENSLIVFEENGEIIEFESKLVIGKHCAGGDFSKMGIRADILSLALDRKAGAYDFDICFDRSKETQGMIRTKLSGTAHTVFMTKADIRLNAVAENNNPVN